MTEIDKKLGELVTIVKKLRSPAGCEWDKQQTSETLIPYLLEEAYEVAESIMDNSSSSLKEELGDLLLHVVFQAVLAEEKDEFSINNVIVSINKKLIKRHPHVFDKDLLSKDVESIKKNWELNKKNEKKDIKINRWILNCLRSSLKKMKVKKLYGLLIHYPQDLNKKNKNYKK